MRRALELARQGWPAVAPNPMVGSVIVHGGEIVAEGFHELFGGPHAEVNAIKRMPANVNPAECELYVTLEPCDHQSKTPPCTDLIISSGFKKVIVACKDPNPLVRGKGIEKLRKAGIEVIGGVLEQEARALNRRFITFHEQGRPYIILKWALSADGFISRPHGSAREDNFISRQEALTTVHQLRAECSGILVGKTTVLIDDPLLTVRHVNGRNPVRLIVDRNLDVPANYKIYNKDAPTIVFNCIKDEVRENVRLIKLEGTPDLIGQVLKALHGMNIQSLLVEGGSRVLQSFIDRNLWDEALVFQNPDLIFGAGLRGPVFALKNTFELVGEDKLYRHIREENSVLTAK
jgi:diaminohydroxyphosphoribosylaminopyrimidine deaminase / 5-amino-6-(5-phosphoribosylamino)uracil reductase